MCHCLLQLLSKGELLAQVPRGLQADLASSNPAETRRALQDRNAIAATKVQQLTQDKTKATQRERLTQLTAPVDGTVQQLAIHSVGGVVTAAQALMIVVPDSATVIEKGLGSIKCPIKYLIQMPGQFSFA